MAITYLSGNRIQGSSVGTTGGKVGTGAGNFDGSDNLHYTGNGDQDGDMTAAFWFYRVQSSPNYLTCYNQVSANGNSSNRLQIGTQAAGTWEIYGAGKILDGGTPPLNTWIHIAVTCNGTTWKLYENGIETDSGTGSSSRTNDGLVSWMAEGSGAWATGYMDEACLYDRTLSTAEVLSLANGSKKPNDATLDTSNSLTLYLPMDTTASSGLTNWYDDKSSTGQAIALTGDPTLITSITSPDRNTITNVPVGTRFEETDTRKIFRRTSSAWVEKGTA